MRTAFCREFLGLGEIGDGQDTRNQFDLDATCGNAVTQAQIEGVMEKELREGLACPVVGLIGQKGEIFFDRN